MSQRVPGWAVETLSGAGFEVRMRDSDAPASSDELVRLVEGARGMVSFLTDRVDCAVIEAGGALEVVSTVAAGYDNIDVAAAVERGVEVCHTPDALTDATADLTMALLLAAARRLPENDGFLREGGRILWRLEQPLMGLDVSGTTIGIVGAGKIGTAVARRARAFGMRIVYTGRSGWDRPIEEELSATRCELDELVRTADVVSLHVPLTDATRGMIDAQVLQAMKPSALLINTSRGALVDEDALADALESGWISGVGLDVFADEPAVNERLLALRERVVLTPHMGSATEGTRRAMLATAVDNVIAALRGCAKNVVPRR
ncbi:D-glycerate dehydrogenase [Microbacterium sp. ET2]|uniref:2-hydroxyacid dehydrogenase n=1 Tax=Microbacterium albipurpureum TaxID=3050384 RepID=UPI00259CF641|nr:D-glycerate dehydrogenase [Microbacterium sp. ET2 (Ac-2212)]WJL96969.1 D-glycerate dehydrogenase [Microbacterium sp. ET2 (Ac-2212)]